MLKVGQKVKICSREKLQETGACFGLDSKMFEYCNKTTIITKIYRNWTSRTFPDFDRNAYLLQIDNAIWVWSNLQLIPVEPVINIF